MIKIYSKLTPFLLLTILLTSCSATNNLTISVKEPAPVYINKNITKIGIINRSIPDEKYKTLDAIDKILSLEGKELDKKGSIAAIDALKETLLKNEYINSVTIIDSIDFKKYGIDQFSNELSWDLIAKICKENNVEAIYELSFYDTDANVNYKVNNKVNTNAFGLKIPFIEHEATINTLIKTGWRIYDNIDKQIRDVYNEGNTVTIVGRGINPLKAFETIAGRKDAVLRASKVMGEKYAYRILPYSLRVNRSYFIKGTPNFEIGKRNAIAGNWDEAATYWLKETNNTKPKLAGRGYYNMAISNEINGNLESALDWATKSYTNFDNKEARNYIAVLKRRIAKRNQLASETR